jgi:hypothetical protein
LQVAKVLFARFTSRRFSSRQRLLLAISFRLLRVVMAISLPIVRVCLTPFSRTLQANLSIKRIGSNLLPMIVTAALALACGLVANKLVGMIRGGLKDLLTVTTTVIFHHAAPEGNKGGSPWKRH